VTTPKAEQLAPGITLYQGDCLAMLPLLSGVGAVVTDPPYGIEYSTHSRADDPRAATWNGQFIAGDGDTRLREVAIDWAKARRLPWLAFGSWKQPKPSGSRGVLIWDKGPGFGMGDLSFPWKASWEEIYVGGPSWVGNRDEGVLKGHIVHSHESRGRCHPNQKPDSLLRYLIRKLPAGTVILDPFAGSGTTLVAAALEGYPAIGAEIDPKYCDVIRRRIDEVYQQTPGTLFAEVKSPRLHRRGRIEAQTVRAEGGEVVGLQVRTRFGTPAFGAAVPL